MGQIIIARFLTNLLVESARSWTLTIDDTSDHLEGVAEERSVDMQAHDVIVHSDVIVENHRSIIH